MTKSHDLEEHLNSRYFGPYSGFFRSGFRTNIWILKTSQIFTSRLNTSTSNYHFFASPTIRLRLQRFVIRLNDESRIGTPLHQNWIQWYPTRLIQYLKGGKIVSENLMVPNLNGQYFFGNCLVSTHNVYHFTRPLPILPLPVFMQLHIHILHIPNPM